jgi:hypothetical protein
MRRANASQLDLTMQALDISTSERTSFKKCRRQWELTVLDNLEPLIPPTFEFEFGAGIHRALEAYYFNVANIPAYPDTQETYNRPLEGALMEWDAWYAETEVRYEQADFDTAVRDAALDHLVLLGDLGEEMLRGYHRYSDEVDDFTVHAIEGHQTPAGKSWLNKHADEREFISANSQFAVIYDEAARRLLVPIIDPSTQRLAKGNPVFSCRIDLLVNRIDPGAKGLWVYDHKTTASIPNDRGLDFDDQITSYCYAVWRWLGIVPRGFCFNYLSKQAPKRPRILKSGALSTAKNQLTTAELYREALQTRGLILRDGTVTSEEHAEAYEALLSYGWDRFFSRQYVTRNKTELLNFERRLFEEWEDMKDCAEGVVPLYPNLSRFHCPNCSVGPICQAIEDGSDWEYVMDTRYVEKPDRKSDVNLADER